MSGTGKSTALSELARRGFWVVETDLPGWSEWLPGASDAESEWLWREDRVASLLATRHEPDLFRVRCVSNQGKFYHLFDAIVLLSAPVDVILDRLDNCRTNDYVERPMNTAASLADEERVEPLLRATCTHEVDGSRPLDAVVVRSSPSWRKPPAGLTYIRYRGACSK
jgi:RNase adaptor protein for sRNA GlmZ degradation